MAANYEQMGQNIRQFYSFSGKKVLGVGAGGGPLTNLVLESRKLPVGGEGYRRRVTGSSGSYPCGLL
jgi:2-polyprenyl-3-methyl-5-hydroxy-6-metoxy-1,4-benzoquinol methylase